MRLIDADNLKARLRNMYKRRESDPRARGIIDDVKGIIDSLIDVIDEEPTIDSVKHAHWTEKYDGYMILCVCSICNARTIMKSNYCPNCGAKMDEAIK